MIDCANDSFQTHRSRRLDGSTATDRTAQQDEPVSAWSLASNYAVGTLVVALIAVLLELVIRRAVAALVLVRRRELLIDGVGCLVHGDLLHLIAGVSRSAHGQTQTDSCRIIIVLNVIGSPLCS